MEEQNQRLRILEMIERGQINVPEALRMLDALHSAPDQSNGSAEASHPFEKSIADHEGERTPKDWASGDGKASSLPSEMRKWQRFWNLPLWIGVIFIILGSFGVYHFLVQEQVPFWVGCNGVLFLLGLLLLLFGARARSATWIHLCLKRAEGRFPESFTFGFPISLRFVQWVLQKFRLLIPHLDNTSLDEVLLALQNNAQKGAPLYIQVQQGFRGEQIEIYIG